MVATHSKNTAGTSWSVGDERSYDVWGGVRSGATTGGPKGRYVANLGHVQDDESGLIYMRARYYELESGRFVSEDPARAGDNWFQYACNDPISNVDKSGKDPISEASATVLINTGLLMALLATFWPNTNASAFEIARGAQAVRDAYQALAIAIGMSIRSAALFGGPFSLSTSIITAFRAMAQILIDTQVAAHLHPLASRALFALGGLAIMTWGYWLWTQED